VHTSNTTNARKRSLEGMGRMVVMDVVTLVILLSDTVSEVGMLRDPKAKAAKSAALAFSSDTMSIAWLGDSISMLRLFGGCCCCC